MRRSFFLFLAATSVALIAPRALHAQAFEHADDHEHTAAHCGMQVFADMDPQTVLANTARNNPTVYRRIIEAEKQTSHARLLLSDEGATHVFNVLNRTTGQLDQVTGVLKFFGRRSRIWVDDRDTARIKATTIAALARGLDSATAATSRNPNKGIIENDEEVYGMPPENRFDLDNPLVQDFLLTDIQDDLSGGYVAGYFSPMDQGNYAGSNRMNLLYIDSKQGLGSQSASAIAGVLSTLAHEYQHLIHYGQNPQSQIFYNEGCSEAASILCGYKSRSNSTYMLSPNVPLLRWSDGSVYTDLEIDYQRAMTFTRYCFEQYGEAYITKLTASRTTGINRVADALQKSGGASDWKSTLKGYAVANYVRKNFSEPQYVYQLALSNSSAKIANTYNDTLTPAGQASVQQYAAVYNMYSFKAPRGVRIKFSGSQSGNFAVMAMLYEGSTLVDVRELSNNVTNTIEGNPGFTRMVFAIVSLSSNSQTISWTVDAVTSGVENEAAAVVGAVALTQVSPNPAHGAVRIGYRTRSAGAVTLQMFDVQGRLVRTVAAAEMLEAGEHTVVVDPEGLPNGVYLVRLVQDGAVATRALVIER